MVSRMEKYHLSNNSESNKRRSEKNNHLYEELSNNKVYAEFIDIENNVVDLANVDIQNSVNKRENYQKSRLFNEERTNYNTEYSIKDKNEDYLLEEQNYNINDVLDKARKNRKELDEEEKKLHLKTVEYSILSDLSQEKEKQEKNQKLSKDEEENLEELIHTITSNSLRKKIDDQLLNELMPSDDSESIISEELLKDIETADIENINYDEEKLEKDDTMDQSFYTKSMDLSEEDFEFEEEEDKSFLEDSKTKKSSKLIIALIIIIILVIIGYVIFKVI